MAKFNQRHFPLESYSLNFNELNGLIYNYSSKISELNNHTLKEFVLKCFMPESTENNLKDLNIEGYTAFSDSNKPNTSHLGGDPLQKLWKKVAFRRNLIIGFIKMLQVICKFAVPYLLEQLVNNFKDTSSHQYVDILWLNKEINSEMLSWLYANLMTIILVISVFLDTQYTWHINKLKYEGIMMLQLLTYSKLIREGTISNSKSQKEKQASINTLISADPDQFLSLFYNFHEAWGNFLNLLMIIITLFFKMRTALPFGIITVFVLFWITSVLTKEMGGVFPPIMKLRDKRIELASDIVQGIKSIKYLCWESIFQRKLQDCRNEEFKFLRKLKYIDCCCLILWNITSISLITATFIAYSLLGYNIYDANILTDIAYFQTLILPLNVLPRNIASIFAALLSFKRVRNYLAKTEASDLSKNKNYLSSGASMIVLRATNMIWSHIDENQRDESLFTLKNISLNIKKDSLNMIIGNVGSGKTALLSAILGQMNPVNTPSGKDHQKSSETSNFQRSVQGTIAYVPQNPWLQKQTIRENILFGNKYDPHFYKECLEACDLLSDIEKFDDRDQYDVGLNGSNLSGGQRQRISLCRALYQDADIYLLDDILSSVDANVAHIIFQKAILGLLKKRNKTVMLVLSQYKYLKYGDGILLVQDGYINEDSDSIKNFLKGFNLKEENEESPKLDKEKDNLQNNKIKIDKSIRELEQPNKLENEQKEKGEVKFKTLKTYINAIGTRVTGWILFGVLLMPISFVYFDFWIREYIDCGAQGTTPWFYFISFEITLFTLMFFAIISCAFRAWIYAYGNLRASKTIFNSLIPKVINAPMRFFDKNPLGRILQRFGEDSWSLDDRIAYRCNGLINHLITFVKTFYVLSIKVPIVLILTIPVSFIFYVLQEKFRIISRELRKMYSANNARLYNHLAETISGITVIKAFEKEDFMIKAFLEKACENLMAKSMMAIMHIWFTFRLRLLSVAVSSLVLIFSLMYKHYYRGLSDFGELALILLYAIASPLNFEDIMVTLADTEKEVIGLERINQYLETKTEQESELEYISHQDKSSNKVEAEKKQNNSIPVSDPFCLICFKNVSMKYYNNGKDHLALKKINLTIRKHEKVAICGRTGSGKTSILNSLLRLYDIEEGEIIFNGKNVIDYPKKTLRSNIAVLPQFGFMYEGTLRENLDPYEILTEEELEKALERGREIIQKAAKKYQQQAGQKGKSEEEQNKESPEIFKKDFRIARGGSNLSNGEKQIINFLRILLQRSPVIVLDEATSNVDPVTDELMHQALFEIFQDKTLIVITHRLEYLKNYDRVVLLEEGEIIQQGTCTDGEFCWKISRFYEDDYLAKLILMQ